ncbi:unnamed protein product, partial [Mesorhabditis spiculigera]
MLPSLAVLGSLAFTQNSTSHLQPNIFVLPGPSNKSCSNEEFERTKGCMTTFIENYNYQLDDQGKLPRNFYPLFDRIQIDAANLCKTFSSLQSCLGSRYEDCLTLETLSKLTNTMDDAKAYAEELALFELYCSNSRRFIEYFQCYDSIEDDELHKAVLDHCDDDLHNPACRDMVTVARCQLVLFQRDCGQKIKTAFCAYNNIRMRMFGYETCEERPCSSKRPSILLVLALAICFYFSSTSPQENFYADKALAPSVCETIDYVTAFNCFQNLIYLNRTVPVKATKFPPFSALKISETNVACDQVDKLNDCLGSTKTRCFDLPTIARYVPSDTSVEAESYLRLFINMNYRCNDTKNYQRYVNCRTAVTGMREQTRTEYSNCGDYRYGDEC